MPFYHPHAPLTLKDKVLLVPLVSTANVAQLAADLLAASLALPRAGLFDAAHLVPAAGGREDGAVGVTAPLELYGREDVGVVIMQPRAPVLKSAKEEFLRALFDFAAEARVSAILFLAGVDPQNRTDAQMAAAAYHLPAPASSPWDGTPLAALPTLTPKYTTPVAQHPLAPPPPADGVPFVPGGGLARRALSSAPSNGPPAGALLQFAAEGDNRGDAAHLAALAAHALGLEVKEWREPKAWAQGLFGAPQDQSLYG